MSELNFYIGRWDEIQKNFLESRKVLYNLEPMGKGTPYVESLTSYISRLAMKHNVEMGTLLKEVVTPILTNEYIKSYLSEGKYLNRVHLINGMSITSIDMIGALEALTGRHDIHQTTMNNWKGLFSQNVLSNYRKWCPQCLNNFKNVSIDIHEPLIWYISEVKKCDVHNIKLIDTCQNCGKKLYVIHRTLVMGHCQFCKKWLGNKEQFNKTEHINEEETFIIDNFKELIVNGSTMKAYPIQFRVSVILYKIMKVLALTSINKLSELLEVNRTSLHSWLHNLSLPNIGVLFRIAKRTNSSIFKLFVEGEINITIDSDHPLKQPKKIMSKKKFKTLKKQIETHLLNAVNEEIPKSLQQICKEGGFSRSNAKRNFPFLSRKIIDNYSDYQKKLKLEKKGKIEAILKEILSKDPPESLEGSLRKYKLPETTARRHCPQLCMEITNRTTNYKEKIVKEKFDSYSREIKRIIIDLHNKNIYPSIPKVNKLAPKKGILLDKRYRKVREELMKDLGYY